jgi:hypothetical protein
VVRCSAAAQSVRRPRREHEKKLRGGGTRDPFHAFALGVDCSGKRHERQDGLARVSVGRRRRPIIAA